MNTEEVAQKVVELVRKQAWHEALDTLYDKDVVSVEAWASDGESPEKHGIDEVRGKTDWWVNAMEVHSFKANGPFVPGARRWPKRRPATRKMMPAVPHSPACMSQNWVAAIFSRRPPIQPTRLFAAKKAR